MSGDDEDHKRGKQLGQFCTEPRDSICADCPNRSETGKKNYQEVCKPRWSKQVFKRIVRRKKKNGGPFIMNKRYEAHHILCVSPVTKELLGKKTIEGSIKQTQWCINKKLNMKAMPLWGHTVQWYCSFKEDDDGTIEGKVKSRTREPLFKNIPQHDFDHNCEKGYTYEVQQVMIKLANDVEKKEHKLKGKTLADTLDNHARDFAKELTKRGTRKDGTHNGWKLAQQDDPEWCHPFSMASNGRVTNAAFPGKNFDDKLEAWIDRIAKGIAGL